MQSSTYGIGFNRTTGTSTSEIEQRVDEQKTLLYGFDLTSIHSIHTEERKLMSADYIDQ